MYDAAVYDCKIDIKFRSREDGGKENECRDQLLEHLRRPTPESATATGARLSAVTGNASGLGLLFLICGKERRGHQLLVARFLADQGVLAEERDGRFSVEFVERVFMKSSRFYKSALYVAPTLASGFWRGKAIDKQIDGPRELSQYWIDQFLLSELVTAGAAGTRRLAKAMLQAARHSEPDVRSQIVAATQLVGGFDGRRQTAAGLLSSMGLSDDAVGAVRRQMGRTTLMDESFQVSAEEFDTIAAYRAVDLDNGATLVAPRRSFEAVFRVQRLAENTARYSTEGRVVDERLRKQR
jgi:hypothetical protein